MSRKQPVGRSKGRGFSGPADGQSVEVSEPGPPIQVTPAEWRIVQALLQKYLPGYPVCAFGSRARGQPKPFSDLDLAIMTEQPLPLDCLAELREAFSESDLPWKVDLVDWARTPETFRAHIRPQLVLLQQAQPKRRRPVCRAESGAGPEDEGCHSACCYLAAFAQPRTRVPVAMLPLPASAVGCGHDLQFQQSGGELGRRVCSARCIFRLELDAAWCGGGVQR